MPSFSKFILQCFGEENTCYLAAGAVVYATYRFAIAIAVAMNFQVNTNPTYPPLGNSGSSKQNKSDEEADGDADGDDLGRAKETQASSGTGVNGAEVIKDNRPMDDPDNDSDHDQSECE